MTTLSCRGGVMTLTRRASAGTCAGCLTDYPDDAGHLADLLVEGPLIDTLRVVICGSCIAAGLAVRLAARELHDGGEVGGMRLVD